MSTIPGCGNCDRPVPDGARLCTTCTTALAEALRGVPELLDDLVVTYSKQDRLSAGGGHRGKLAEAPLPVRFDVSFQLAGLGNELTTWARDLVDRYVPSGVPDAPRRAPHNGRRGPVFPATTPQLDLICYAAQWLAGHVDLLRRHPAAMEAFNGITGAIAAAELACGAPPVRLFIDMCDACDAYLYAKPDDKATRCERCDTQYTDVAQRWDRALLRLRGYPATAEVLAGSIGQLYGVIVSKRLIHSWHCRRTITQVDTDPDTGEPRFRIGEVLDRAAASKPRKAG